MAEQSEPGDLSAAELFREHGAFVARFLFRLGVPADAIQDTVQEVFLVVHQRGGYRQGPAKPTSYLAMIASNAASAQRRKARARSSRTDDTEPDALTARGADPAHTLEIRDALGRLQAALDKLDPELRATLLLADGEGETCASIAEAMGVPVGTVYWRLHQARKRFQRALMAVDASWQGPRPSRSPASVRADAAAPVLQRSAKMLTIFLGLGLPSWRGSQAQALLHETATQMPIEFDLQAELRKHTEAAARVPVPTPSTIPQTPPSHVGTFGTMTGATKVGLIAATTGATLIAALQWRASQHEVLPRASHESSAAMQESAPLPQVSAYDQSSPPSETSALAEAAGRANAHEAPLPRDAQPHSYRESTGPKPAHRSRASTPPASIGKLAAAGSRRAATSPTSEEEQPAVAEPGAQEDPMRKAPSQPPPQSQAVSVEMVEAQALGRAESLLHKDPAQALAIVRKVALSGQADYLAEERRYIEVMALYALNQRVDARRAADAFLSSYPQSVFRERVTRARD